MSEYKGIKGFQVQTRSEDPTPTEVQTGDFYYNSSTGQFKVISEGGAPIGTWSSGGNTNLKRSTSAGAGVSSSAALLMSGYDGSNPTNAVEQYNGSSWTEVSEVNTGRSYVRGCGTYTAALCTGGSPSSGSGNELWNGSGWTEVGDLSRPNGRSDGGQFGTTAAALAFGGEPVSALTEIWDGTSWTEVNDLNTARFAVTGFGTTTAGVAANGREPSVSSSAEDWNGTSWTASGNLNTARGDARASGVGPATTGIIFSGSTGNHTNTVTNTESYNGSTWSEVADLSLARYRGIGAGTASSALMSTGTNPAVSGIRSTATEEWSAAEFQIKSVTQS